MEIIGRSNSNVELSVKPAKESEERLVLVTLVVDSGKSVSKYVQYSGSSSKLEYVRLVLELVRRSPRSAQAVMGRSITIPS